MERPSLTIAWSSDNTNIHCDLELTGLPKAAATFLSPLQQQDADEVRWLIEKRPRLHSSTSREVAMRIKARLLEIGAELGAAVFSQSPETRSIASSLSNSVANVEVRVVEKPACPWVPWEVLPVPGLQEPLSCLTASFVRRRLMRRSQASLATNFNAPAAGLRILLVVARPSGSANVPFRSVASRVVGATAARGQNRIRIDLLRPPSLDALGETLARAASEGFPYQIVHFDGHGEFRESPFLPGVRRGYLCFENEDETVNYVDGSRIGEMLVENGVSALLLNACRSAYTETETAGTGVTPFESLAGDVLSAGLSSVLAMGFDVYVVTAAALIADVYAALASGRTLGEAVVLARQHLVGSTEGCDWMVPVIFEQEPAQFTIRRDEIAWLPVGPNAATPATEFFIDPEGRDGPRSTKHPFVGYDSVMLDLDRTLRKNQIVQIVGLAGSGKSAVVAEFARWMAWTQSPKPSSEPAPEVSSDLVSVAADCLKGRLAIIALDVPKFSDIRGLLGEAVARIAVLAGSQAPGTASGDVVMELLLKAATRLNIVWILDDADALLTADNEAARAVRKLATGEFKILLTGRSYCALDGIPTLPLTGLDVEAINDFAVAYQMPTTTDSAVLEVWLDWTQGLPALVLAVLPKLARPSDDALLRARKEIRGIQLGDEPGGELAEACGISKLMLPNDFSDERTLMALYLFQGFVSSEGWSHFAALLSQFSQNYLGGEKYNWSEVTQELRGAERRGVVCPINADWLMIHPLAPFAVTPHFYEMCNKMAGPNASDRHRRWVLGLFPSTFCQALLLPQLASLQPLPPGLESRTRRQSLLLGAALTIESAWWHLIRILRRVRDELRPFQREREWRQILNEAWQKFQKSPPTEEQSAIENPTRLLARLFAEEAEFNSQPESARQLHDIADQLAYQDKDKTLALPQRPKEWNVGSYPVLDTLLRRAEQLTEENSPSALQAAEAARDVASEMHDELRLGEVYLVIARIYGRVASLRDPHKYEEYAKRAVAAGEAFRDEGLVIRAKKSVGIAIVEQLQQTPAEATEGRKREAAAALSFAKLKAGKGDTWASAANGLGMLLGIENKLVESAQEFLEAAEQFAAIEQGSSAVTAYANAALAYYKASRLEDAVSAAAEGLKISTRLAHPPSQVVELLQTVHQAATQPQEPR